MKSSVSVKNNLTTQVQVDQAQVNQASSHSTTVPNIIIQLPPQQFYQNSNFQGQQVQSTSPLSSNAKLPTIGEFLNNLDLKYNCNNVYSNFEKAFLEEEITVNAIKNLSDEQLQKLGVVKIGWQMNIKQAAHQF